MDLGHVLFRVELLFLKPEVLLSFFCLEMKIKPHSPSKIADVHWRHECANTAWVFIFERQTIRV